MREAAGDVSPAMTLEELFSTHARFVWRTLWHFGVAEADLEDQSQEVFLVAHRRWEALGAQHPRTWLYDIARRCAAAYRRRGHRRREHSVETVPETTDTRDPSARAEIDLLNRVLASLDHDKRSVFLLYEVEEMSMREVAEVLQCPIQAAYARYHAARRELTRALEEAK
jgi:RNA polymerase sigma-70 factor, ECF subfamily